MYLIALIFLIVYSVGLTTWDKRIKWRLNPKLSTYLKFFHFICLCICFVVAILYNNYHIGLKGLWTTRVIIVLTLITGIFFVLVADKSSINRPERWYFKIFSFLPILTAGTLLIPFLGVIIVFSLYGKLIDPASKIYYEDEKMRVQSTFIGVLGPPSLEIFEKNLIFEKRLKKPDVWVDGIDSIKVSYDRDSTRIVVYGLYEYDEKRKGETKTICLER